MKKILLVDHLQKGEIITGSVSGATSTVLAEDVISNSRLFISANNGWITGETLTGSTSGATAKVAKYRANPVENIQQLLNYYRSRPYDK